MGRRDHDDRLLDELARSLSSDGEPPSEGIARLRAQADELRRSGAGSLSGTAEPRRFGRRGLLASGAAASVGAVAGAGVVFLADEDPASPPTESVAVSAQRDGVTASAQLINHTWGVEYLLEAGGLTAGRKYRVVYHDADGNQIRAGSFLGIDGTVSCRMTAAVLRDQVRKIEVLDRDVVVLRTRLT